MYALCSKILNSFLSLISNEIYVFRAGVNKMLVRITNRKDLIGPLFRSRVIWVWAVWLGLFSRQLVFKILEYYQKLAYFHHFMVCKNVIFKSYVHPCELLMPK